MEHIDPEVIALIAIGDRAQSDEERDHLATCAECARDLRELASVAEVGRGAGAVALLEHPNPRVWDAIAKELEVAVPIAVRPPRRRRWVSFALAAVIVGVLVVAGTMLWNSVQSSTDRQLASATLEALPSWHGASGSATVTKLSDGARQVVITLTGAKADSNFREAWLATSDLKHLVRVGVITGNHGTFALPADVDLKRFDVVDVSSEPHDGNPHHSGNSIVRGVLS